MALFDVMIANLDHSLREMGVGDLSVGGKVKTMAQAFYGRLAAYDRGLDGGGDLAGAVFRNLYRSAPAREADAEIVAAYMRRQDEHLAALDDGALLAGDVVFAAIEEAGR